MVGKKTLLRASVSCGLLSLSMALASAPAAAQSMAYQIQDMSLSRALREYGRTSGRQIIFTESLVRGRRAPALVGVYPPDEALTRLLAGSGLRAQTTPAGAIMIVRAEGGQTLTGEAEAGGAAADSGSAEDQAIVVTGTLIRGVSPTSPVITYEREEIEDGGYTTTQDLLARVPQNFSGVTPTTGTASGNVGLTTQADIRGLGPQATLTLVNGRRVAGAAGNSGRAFDITMIPVAAIERVAILTDGASALYGSDAVAGVINIVLRRDYEGAETTVQYGLGESGRQTFLASQVVGARWSTGRILGAVQYDRRDARTTASLDIDSLDFRPRGGGDFRTVGFGSPGTVYGGGFFQGRPFSTITGPGGSPVFFATLPPGDGRNVQISQLGLNQRSVFDPVAQDAIPEQDNISGYLTIEQDIGPITLFADAVYARRRGLQTIVPNSNFFFVPTTNAFSRFAEPVLVGYVLNEFGPITASAESEGWFANLGARGRFGASGWTWELVGSRSEDEFATRVSSVDTAELNRRLALSDPAQAFNPFGNGMGQSPGVVDAIRTQFAFAGTSETTSVNGQVQGEVFTLPAGPVRLLAGAEYREEQVDTRTERPGFPPTLLFPSAERDLYAGFAEAYIPIFSDANARPGLRELALSLAGRFEHYSDFGGTTNPKIGVLWSPTEDLTFRANWGTSFRAPGLRELFAVSRVSPNFQVLDPRAPGGPRTVFVDFIFGGNPNLGPEEAETYTISAAYRPRWLPGARLSGGYYHIDYTNRIRGSGDGLTAPFLLSIEDQLPSGIIVRRPDGTLQTLNLININAARTELSGLDVEAGYQWTIGDLGSFNLAAGGTFVFERREQLINGAPILDLRGKVGNPPEWRARGSLSWSRRPWAATLSVNHTDDLFNDSPDTRIVRRDVDSQTTVDFQLSLSFEDYGPAALHGLTLRVGATNVFNVDPPFVDGGAGFDPRNHDLNGRMVYFRLSKSFGAGR